MTVIQALPLVACILAVSGCVLAGIVARRRGNRLTKNSSDPSISVERVTPFDAALDSTVQDTPTPAPESGLDTARSWSTCLIEIVSLTAGLSGRPRELMPVNAPAGHPPTALDDAVAELHAAADRGDEPAITAAGQGFLDAAFALGPSVLPARDVADTVVELVAALAVRDPLLLFAADRVTARLRGADDPARALALDLSLGMSATGGSPALRSNSGRIEADPFVVDATMDSTPSLAIAVGLRQLNHTPVLEQLSRFYDFPTVPVLFPVHIMEEGEPHTCWVPLGSSRRTGAEGSVLLTPPRNHFTVQPGLHVIDGKRAARLPEDQLRMSIAAADGPGRMRWQSLLPERLANR